MPILWDMISDFRSDEVMAPIRLPIKKVPIVANLFNISQRRYDQKKKHIQIVQWTKFELSKIYSWEDNGSQVKHNFLNFDGQSYDFVMTGY